VNWSAEFGKIFCEKLGLVITKTCNWCKYDC